MAAERHEDEVEIIEPDLQTEAVPVLEVAHRDLEAVRFEQRTAVVRANHQWPDDYRQVGAELFSSCPVGILRIYSRQARKADDWETMELLHKELIKKVPSDSLAYLFLVWALERLGKYAEAIPYAETLYRLRPIGKNRHFCERLRFLAALEKDPAATISLEALGNFDRGGLIANILMARKKKNFEVAFMFGKELLRRNPKSVTDLLSYEGDLKTLGKFEEAMQIRGQIEALRPSQTNQYELEDLQRLQNLQRERGKVRLEWPEAEELVGKELDMKIPWDECPNRRMVAYVCVFQSVGDYRKAAFFQKIINSCKNDPRTLTIYASLLEQIWDWVSLLEALAIRWQIDRSEKDPRYRKSNRLRIQKMQRALEKM